MPPKAKLEDTQASEPRFVATVTAPGGPRRRAGFSFSKEPVHLTDAELDEDKVAALKSDPQLVIRDYQAPAEANGAPQE